MEDHLPNILRVRRVLQPSGDVQLVVVRDGITAMDYLHHTPPYESAARPDLILLDLDLPQKDGRDVLLEIKNDPVLRRIPVLLLPSPTEQSPRRADLDGLQVLVASIREVWLEAALSPWRSAEIAEA